MIEINREHLETDLQRVRAKNHSSPYRAWLGHFAWNAFAFVGVMPFLIGDGLATYDPHNVTLWYWVGAAVFMTVINAVFESWSFRNRASLDLEVASSRIERRMHELTGAGWVRRTIKLGAYMGLGVSLTIGLLMLVVLPAEFGVGRERWEGVAMFTLGTFAWTLPAAFAIRWLSLYSMRRYVRRTDS